MLDGKERRSKSEKRKEHAPDLEEKEDPIGSKNASDLAHSMLQLDPH